MSNPKKNPINSKSYWLYSMLAALLVPAIILGCPTDIKAASPSPAHVLEEDLSICEQDDDCVLVPYQHCCGSNQRAINRKFSEIYKNMPKWQVYDDENVCSVIGMCNPGLNESKTTKCVSQQTTPAEKRCEIILENK